jgi:hypothetical protein
MDLVDLAIHGVVCQKSDFHGNSDIKNSQKLDPLEITEKNLGQNMLAFQSAKFNYLPLQIMQILIHI